VAISQIITLEKINYAEKQVAYDLSSADGDTREVPFNLSFQ
jgi:hypothetical protein|tara:strand:+ start:137 stop:259 length:123 start_codon:yes stop_codon:yes gene_type:complete